VLADMTGTGEAWDRAWVEGYSILEPWQFLGPAACLWESSRCVFRGW
jgi:hypothetical protein